jgi:hypothetical protein
LAEYTQLLATAKQEYFENAEHFKTEHIAQTDLLKTELAIKQQINDKLNEAIQKLLGELSESKKIIGSNRLHFKELEKADFDTLQ